MRICLRVTVLSLLMSPAAYAWNGKEHAATASLAYARACIAVEALLKTVSGGTDPQVQQRLEVACRHVPVTPGVTDQYVLQSLFGDWTAIAGDHTDQPSQLTNLMLSDLVVDYRKFTRLAITNYRHFHPIVTRSWRTYHLKALDAAVAAGSAQQLAMPEIYESALATEAFAEHYLQDSFSAGHMGFNRVASSNAAALSYHNRASKSGRCVANLNGELWFTYGDDHLTENDDTWQHVLDASTMSLAYFISSFVSGVTDTTGVDNVAARLPAFMKDTRSEIYTQCQFAGKFVSLRSVSLPAETATTWDFWFVRDATAYYEKPTMLGYMIGGSIELAPIPIGYRTIQTRFQAGIGRTYSEIGPHAWLFDIEYLWHVGTSNRGIFTHELGIGRGEYWAHSVRYEQPNLRGIYNVNIEAGGTYVRIQVALARSSFRWGPYVAIGVGSVRRASR